MAIAKISRPRTARATVNYLLEPLDHAGRERGKVALIASTIGQTSEMAVEYLGAISKLRPRLSRHLYHVSISVSPSERNLSNQEWAELGRAWCAEMGIQNYMIVSHDNHIHIVASRIRFDGTAAPDSFDFRRSELALRKLEAQFDLWQTSSSHLVDPSRRSSHRRARSLAELHAIAREGGSGKDFIRAAIDAALAETSDATQLRETLAKVGIDMTILQTPDGQPFALFDFGGRRFGPRALGQGYSLRNLVENGLQLSGPQGAPAHLPRPPWGGGDVPGFKKPRVAKNHEEAVCHLRRLGREAHQTIERFRDRDRADVGLPDPDLYRPGSDGSEEPPDVT